MTKSKRIPNTPIEWNGTSNSLPGLLRADLGPEPVWGGNRECSGPTGHKAGQAGDIKQSPVRCCGLRLSQEGDHH